MKIDGRNLTQIRPPYPLLMPRPPEGIDNLALEEVDVSVVGDLNAGVARNV